MLSEKERWFQSEADFTSAHKEIRAKVIPLHRRLDEINEVLRSERSQTIIEKLNAEKEDVWQEIHKVRATCQHELVDRSVGGGLFCSICNKWLGMYD